MLSLIPSYLVPILHVCFWGKDYRMYYMVMQFRYVCLFLFLSFFILIFLIFFIAIFIWLRKWMYMNGELAMVYSCLCRGILYIMLKCLQLLFPKNKKQKIQQKHDCIFIYIYFAAFNITKLEVSRKSKYNLNNNLKSRIMCFQRSQSFFFIYYWKVRRQSYKTIKLQNNNNWLSWSKMSEIDLISWNKTLSHNNNIYFLEIVLIPC